MNIDLLSGLLVSAQKPVKTLKQVNKERGKTMIINIKENLDYLIGWFDIYHFSYHGDWTRNDNGRIFIHYYDEDDPHELMIRLYCEMYMKEKKEYYKGIYYKLIDNTSVYFDWR